MPKEPKSNRLKVWLESRFTEAQLSAGEIREFTGWLIQRSTQESVNPEMPNRKGYTLGEVHEFMTWVKLRMSTTSLTAAEKQQFNTWFLSRLDDFDEKELEEIQSKLDE